MSSSRSELRPALAGPAAFADNATHLRAELGWVHQLIRAEVRAAVSGPGEAAVDEFAGLYISREEIERYLAHEPAGANGHGAPDSPVRPFPDEPARARAALDRRIELSIAVGVDLRFERLAR